MKKLTMIMLPFLLMAFTPKNNIKTKIDDGKDLIKAVYKRYHKKAHKYITFQQKTTFYRKSGDVAGTQTWYEAMSLPGNLHIRFGDMEKGNGAMYKDGFLYRFKEGKMMRKEKKYNELLVLGSDVYHQKPSKTFDILEEMAFDLSKLYKTTHNGREVYVVGTTDKNDLASNQFWVDAERLYLVRLIKKETKFTLDVTFDGHEKLGKAWFERKVAVKINDKMYMTEEYSNVKAHKSLDKSIFETENFKAAKW